MEEICKELGFVGENVQMYARKVSIITSFGVQMVLTFLRVLKILYKGLHVDNHKLSLLLFERNHPHYHQLMSHGKLIEVLIPPQIRNLDSINNSQMQTFRAPGVIIPKTKSYSTVLNCRTGGNKQGE